MDCAPRALSLVRVAEFAGPLIHAFGTAPVTSDEAFQTRCAGDPVGVTQEASLPAQIDVAHIVWTVFLIVVFQMDIGTGVLDLLGVQAVSVKIAERWQGITVAAARIIFRNEMKQTCTFQYWDR